MEKNKLIWSLEAILGSNKNFKAQMSEADRDITKLLVIV